MKKYALLLAATLCTSACAQQAPTQAPATAESASQAIANAEASATKVDQVGFQWRDTQKLIADAKAAAEKQDYATAQKLANEAEQQGALAYQQYEHQSAAYKNAKHHFE